VKLKKRPILFDAGIRMARCESHFGQDVKEEKIWRNTRHTNTVACGFWQRAIYFFVVERVDDEKPSLSSSARFSGGKDFPFNGKNPR
jgi:hypothetical protein